MVMPVRFGKAIILHFDQCNSIGDEEKRFIYTTRKRADLGGDDYKVISNPTGLERLFKKSYLDDDSTALVLDNRPTDDVDTLDLRHYNAYINRNDKKGLETFINDTFLRAKETNRSHKVTKGNLIDPKTKTRYSFAEPAKLSPYQELQQKYPKTVKDLEETARLLQEKTIALAAVEERARRLQADNNRLRDAFAESQIDVRRIESRLDTAKRDLQEERTATASLRVTVRDRESDLAQAVRNLAAARTEIAHLKAELANKKRGDGSGAHENPTEPLPTGGGGPKEGLGSSGAVAEVSEERV